MKIPSAPELPVKAVICTVYDTLLTRGAAPPDAESVWTQLWREKLHRPPRITLAEFNRAADLALQTETNILDIRGVENPTPYWPAVAEQLLPELGELSDESVADFLYTHAQLRRSVQLAPGADATLRALQSRGVLLGLICNGQPYSPAELALALHNPQAPVASFLSVSAAHEAFASDGVARQLAIFTQPLCFWAYTHGFGKPNVHAFQHVATRLRARRIVGDDVLMIGYDALNDLAPARRFGWRTWLLAPAEGAHGNVGTWTELRQALGLAPRAPDENETMACIR